jgi:dTDP-4-dehydrorhamnose reductase
LDIPKTLIVGAGGMLGRAWRETLDAADEPYRPLTRAELDITDAAAVAKSIPAGVKVVVNCAGWTDVDGAEEHEAEATKLNGDAVGILARHCAAIHATLVHYSTDYVFSGEAETPYPVDAPLSPASAYGRSKAAGERALQDAGGPHLLIRTSWLYAPWGHNFVRTMLRLTAERDTLKVVDDQRGRPTSATHLAATTRQLLAADARGTFHVTDGGECTWHGLAKEIARQASSPGETCDVQPCTTADFPRPAPRPAYSVLDLSKAEAIVGPMRVWKQSLKDVIESAEN